MVVICAVMAGFTDPGCIDLMEREKNVSRIKILLKHSIRMIVLSKYAMYTKLVDKYCLHKILTQEESADGGVIVILSLP